MPNINNYLEWRGDLKLENDPLNEVDNMILSRFSYMPFNKIEISEDETMGSIAEKIKDFPVEEFNIAGDKPLANHIVNSARFKDLKVTDYEENTDLSVEKQFAAITIHLGNGEIYVSFCGTDNSIVGWKEDFNLSFSQHLPSQIEGVEYLKRIANRYSEKIHVGGHSKGGNVAAYAAIFAGQEVQNQIIDITNHDGPGFDGDIIQKEEYKKILDKFVTYIPQSSVIGRLLEHKEKNIVVKSTERGIMQHDIYSWQINAKYAITELQVTKESDLVRNIIKTWLEDTTPEQRKNVIDIIYNILVSADATTMRDLSSAKVKSLGRILKLYNKVDENDKKLILKVFASLGTATKQNLKTREPKKEIILNKKKIWTKGNI